MLIAHGVPGDALHRRIFELVGKERPRVAYLGAANGDEERWYRRVAETLTKLYGARVDFARTVGADAAPPELDGADIVYVAGGDVSALSERVQALGLDEIIRRQHERGAVLVGVSAGAIGLTRYWVEFEGDDPVRRIPCVGALPFALDCHDEDSDWEELRALLLRWAAEEPDATIDAYGIPAGAALEMDAVGKVSHHVHPPKWLRLQHGRVVEV